LIQSKLNRSYGEIGTSTYGIVFFGTPHRGGNNAKLGAVVADVFRAILGNPKNTFMEALKGKSSPFSDDLVRKFQLLVQDYSILSFFETRHMGRIGMVCICWPCENKESTYLRQIVPAHSATLGSGTNEKQIPIDADHRQMCKFDFDQDLIYSQVSKNIVELTEHAIRDYRKNLDIGAERARLETLNCVSSSWLLSPTRC
jgi:hypothetical protein